MNFFIHGFTVLLYNPLFNALVLLYLYLPGRDFGVAVIVLTILIRIVLYPLMVKSLKSQKNLSELQPKMQEIQEKHKNDKEMQTKEMMALYQREKINPFGGCLPILLQFPILIALYQVFWKGLGPNTMHHLYSFIPNPGTISTSFLGLINLTEPSIVLAVLSGIIQFFQTKTMTPQKKNVQGKKDQMSQFSDIMQKEMLYFFPILTVFILWRLPSAIGLYWIVTGLFSIYQQILVNRETKLKTI
ncbi:MAG: YidC/Oxa1 family membrane protein insertase [Candidatus Nealsonbacteria bacterium]|nr:YidC/Oxa1 family membrane protein insertase [Candidatus Nealsonbacteria bacterium]